MRTIVFFDLPTETAENRRNYTRFRKMLLRNGFVMLQESVYTRMLITPSLEKSVVSIIKKNRPPDGIIQVLTVTEKQYQNMEFVTGEEKRDIIDSDERLIIL